MMTTRQSHAAAATTTTAGRTTMAMPSSSSANTSSSPKKFIESIVKRHQIVVFAKSWCPYCIQAKAILESPVLKQQAGQPPHENVDIRFYDIDSTSNNTMAGSRGGGGGYLIEQELIFMTGGGGRTTRRTSNSIISSDYERRVFPSVWVNGMYLGGNDELQVAFSNGQLFQSLQKQQLLLQ